MLGIAAGITKPKIYFAFGVSTARNFGQMDVVIIGMITIGIVGKFMDEILKLLEKRVLTWNF